MEAQTRNFSALKEDRFDDEGVETVSGNEQVSSSYTNTKSLRFYLDCGLVLDKSGKFG